MLIGLISLRLADRMPHDPLLGGAAGNGPTVGIAALTEESLKLAPLVVLVFAAPCRARRFAAVDWLLAGFAAGAAFLTVEEAQRRLGLLAPGSGGPLRLICEATAVADRLDCLGVVRFGLNPFTTASPAGGLLGVTAGPVYAGHHLLTALTAAAVGLAIVLWRAAPSRRSGSARAAQRIVATMLPTAALWIAIADHVVYNASAASKTSIGPGELWLAPDSTVPTVFTWWYHLTGHGHGRAALLVSVLLVLLLADASRASRRDWWALSPEDRPTRMDRLNGRLLRLNIAGRPRWLWHSLTWTARSVAAMCFLTVRDLAQALAAHARQPGETHRQALLRGRAVLAMQRETRELAADLDAGDGRRWIYRVVAAAALVALLTLGLWLAPIFADSIGSDPLFRPDRWLAGLAQDVLDWWQSLSPTEKVLLPGTATLVLAIPFGIGWGMFLAGGLTYLIEHGHGLAALAQDPRRATRDYLSRRGAGGIALDAGELLLTFVPAGLGAAGAAPLVGARGVVRDYLDDPATWRAVTRTRLRDERGVASWGHPDGLARVNGARPRNHAFAGRVYDGPKWTATLAAKYPGGVRFSTDGFPDFAPYATHTVQLDKFSGVRRIDERVANRLAGLSDTPAGHTWHHHHDGRTMLLVPRDIHEAVAHTGGHAVAKP